ncbi:MAG: potassium channel protein [Desulfovibrio sp.]|nr:potassium channel protein [Desulfovibrio sp.]MBI4960572.1 potassium channel protein [Desulfovibrio sp.]
MGILWPVISGLFAILLIFVGGTAAYMIVEGWDLFDSVYMVIISLTTVGYGEVHPLTRAGRVITAIVLLLGVGTFFYLAGAIVQLVIEGHIQNIFGRRRMQRAIEKMKGHTIVCGYGRIGGIVAREILAEGHGVVVVERGQNLIEELQQKNIHYVAGDATKDEVLLAAGLHNAKSLVSALTDESANVYVTLTARQLNPDIYIVARSDSPDHSQRLTRAGANQVLFPHLYGGIRMAQSVLRPTVLGFMDLAMRGDIEDLQMEQLTIATGSPVAGKDLIESQLRQRFNVIVIGIKKPDGKLLFNPQPQVVLEAGDTLILVGGKQNLAEMQKQLT